jgi:3-isopropylmalate/(R)-2-methylmalate dehydratase large subunit
MTEKIFARHARDGEASAGEVIYLAPDVVLLNDVSGPVAFKVLEAMSGGRLFDPDRLVLVADHFSPAKDVLAAELIRGLREFARKHRIRSFFDTGNGGIEHALLAEIGRVRPGALIFGADSHTCTAGALNASGVGFGSTDLAAAMATGELWVSVPQSIRVDLSGAPGAFVTGKDVILDFIRRIGVDGALDASIEIGGPGLAALTVDERFAIANMAVEAGATTCILEFDDCVRSYILERGVTGTEPVQADDGAAYVARHTIALDAIEPTVAAPPSPAAGQPVSCFAGTKVDQVYVGNCSNGTLTDLRQAASVLRGRRVATGVRMFVVPATQKIYLTASSEGLLNVFVQAGAAVLPPTCGACFGGHMGILAAGETAIATTNRNFRGRMGHPDSRVFLANAWVASAAAVAGEIVHPAELRAVVH